MIATHGKYYDFMYQLHRAQSIAYPDIIYYYVYRVADPNTYRTSNSILYGDMVIVENRIYTKGVDNVYNGCVLKTIDAMKYIKNTHKYDYIVRTNCGSYYNHNNLKTDLSNSSELRSALINGIPVLYGIHTGNMAYGSFMIYNTKAVDLLIENALNTVEFKNNRVDDLAFTVISRELGFACINRNSQYIYDSIHEFTGIAHLGEIRKFDSKWLMYKQKTCVDEMRDTSDIYRYLLFVKEYDIVVYNTIHIQNDNYDIYYVGSERQLANTIYRECEFLWNFNKMEYFNYNFTKCMEFVKYYDNRQLRSLILWILRLYIPNITSIEYLHILARYFTDIDSISPELFHYKFYDKWQDTNLFEIFRK